MSLIDNLKKNISDSENVRKGTPMEALSKTKKTVARKMTKGERMIAKAKKKGKSIFPYESEESNNDKYQP